MEMYEAGELQELLKLLSTIFRNVKLLTKAV